MVDFQFARPALARLPGRAYAKLLPAWLRAFVRTREIGLALAALFVGALAGLLVAGLSAGSQFAPLNSCSGFRAGLICPYRSACRPGAPSPGQSPAACCSRRSRFGPARRFVNRMADAIEANALHGGRLSMSGSVFITSQTFISNAFGASVGLEAAYTQISAALASLLGRGLAARRNDMRLLVGCGAAGAIAAAFGAPLAGAFYGFEVVLGAYSVGSLVPVVASALVATFVSDALIGHGLLGVAAPLSAARGSAIGHVIVLAAVCSLASIGLMQTVAAMERLFSKKWTPPFLRMAIGGVIVGGLATLAPQALGSGHGALEVSLERSVPLATLALLIVVKAAASAVSLGSGFRGGLFFASLLIGAMIGQFYAEAVSAYTTLHFDAGVGAVAGLAAFTTGVLGAPVTMTVLALEMTGDFDVTVAALIASAIASLVVREGFGYSFATWRFHLRGETIRGPADIGWMRDLTVARMMRHEVTAMPADTSIAAARLVSPLGAEKQIFLLDGEGAYAGLVPTAGPAWGDRRPGAARGDARGRPESAAAAVDDGSPGH